MTPARLRALVLQHADMVAEAEAHRRTALRLAEMDPERAEMAQDEAAEMRFRADALAELLEPMGVFVPEPNQLALMGLGDVK